MRHVNFQEVRRARNDLRMFSLCAIACCHAHCFPFIVLHYVVVLVHTNIYFIGRQKQKSFIRITFALEYKLPSVSNSIQLRVRGDIESYFALALSRREERKVVRVYPHFLYCFGVLFTSVIGGRSTVASFVSYLPNRKGRALLPPRK